MTTSTGAGGDRGPRSAGRRRGGPRARTALATAGCAATFAAGLLARRRGGGPGSFPGERLVRGASAAGGLALGGLVLGTAAAAPRRVRRAAELGALAAAAGLAQGGSAVLFDVLDVLFRRMTGPDGPDASTGSSSPDGSSDPDAPEAPGVDAGRVVVRSLALASAALTASAAARNAEHGAAACARCGRPAPDGRLRAPSWSGYAAVALSLPYPVVKLSWECGSDIGITRPELIHGLRGGWVPVVPALVGSVLSLALVRPWGRAVPRWVPAVGGARVPRLLVLGPACFSVALLSQVGPAAFAAGVRHYFGQGKASAGSTGSTGSIEDFGLRPWVPLTFYTCWMLWGVALGAATWEYHRTTAGCPACAPG
ncbi:hypothetical protein ACFC58_15415 [Kitasatospora purpeofusca]|uniref:hypothetical protein n=1 Tax=Kitasatospora purpeofusca TaxID=67352 RepID=UPI0035E10B47